MTEFETTVLKELSEIKVSLATTTQAQVDHTRRIEGLELYNTTQEHRHWIKSLVVGAGVIVLHPLARKLGFDI